MKSMIPTSVKATLPGLGVSPTPPALGDGVPEPLPGPEGSRARTLRQELSRRLRVGSFDLRVTERGWEGTVLVLVSGVRLGVRLAVDRERDRRTEEAAERL